jgi:AcrR family transcriptional regulator
MARDSQETRRRILAAATAEFAQSGIAGARVDRIAASAGCNKSLLYTYFGNKEALFETVFDSLVAEMVTAIPIDTTNLAEYAGRLFDRYCSHPEVVRLALWDRLERDGRGMQVAGVAAADSAKLAALARGQAGGTISSRLSPADTLAAITLISSLWPLMQPTDDTPSPARLARMRIAVTTIVSRLTAPDRAH